MAFPTHPKWTIDILAMYFTSSKHTVVQFPMED
uniref:Uncharacterized protein n=1 Tax=Rhizophora mucronata TaxID=61149 RepID=A0A2P2NU03_RHIMU